MRDYSAPIWSLLMFEAFLSNVMGGASAAGRTDVPLVMAAG
jgi:hypothetical protein